MHNVSKADVVLLNSGTLRSDDIHAAGVFKKKVSIDTNTQQLKY